MISHQIPIYRAFQEFDLAWHWLTNKKRQALLVGACLFLLVMRCAQIEHTLKICDFQDWVLPLGILLSQITLVVLLACTISSPGKIPILSVCAHSPLAKFQYAHQRHSPRGVFFVVLDSKRIYLIIQSTH